MVVKRYNIKSLAHRLSRAFKRSRAAVSWRAAHLLQFYGIATAAPIAMIEHRFGPIRGRAYYICEYQQGITARDYFNAEPQQDVAQVTKQIKKIITTFRQFHIAHGDMKATNLLINNGQVSVIDLDNLRQFDGANRFHRAHRKDIMRLLKNWAPDSSQGNIFKDIVE